MKRDSRHTLLFILADPVIKEHCLSLKKCHINYNIEFLNNEEFHFKDFYAGNTFVLCDKDDSIEKAVKSGLPVIAVSHPFNREESLFGTPYMILLDKENCPEELLTPGYLEKVFCRHYHIPLVIGESSRFLLRELSMDNLEDLLRLDLENISDEDALFFPREYLTSRHRLLHCESFLKDYISCQYAFFEIGFYGIIDKKSDDFLGFAGFNTPGDHSAEIGYVLKKKFRRQGIGTEILPVLLNYFRTLYPALPIRVSMKKDNIASRKLAEKYGLHCDIH